MKHSSDSLSLKDILEVALENKVPKMISFISSFEDTIARMQELLGKEVSYANIQKHRVCLKYLKNFAKEQYRWNDFPFAKPDHKFITEFMHYLKTKGGNRPPNKDIVKNSSKCHWVDF